LENTLIVVTSDNGMAFPAAKANLMEYGTHVPLAICLPGSMKGGRIVFDLVSVIDLAPTFLELAGIKEIPEMTGISLADLLIPQENHPDKVHREFVLTGRERHTHARPDNLGYPSRALRTQDYLYIRNFKPDLWPAGDPVDASDTISGPSQEKKPLWPGYHDVDDSPSKLYIMENQAAFPSAYAMAFERRPAEQLFSIVEDPACLQDLSSDPAYAAVRDSLRHVLDEALTRQGDPRVLGHGDIFDSYPRHSRMRDFPGFKRRGEYNPDFIQEGQQTIK
jgi:uncharacterized sulfatase